MKIHDCNTCPRSGACSLESKINEYRQHLADNVLVAKVAEEWMGAENDLSRVTTVMAALEAVGFDKAAPVRDYIRQFREAIPKDQHEKLDFLLEQVLRVVITTIITKSTALMDEFIAAFGMGISPESNHPAFDLKSMQPPSNLMN